MRNFDYLVAGYYGMQNTGDDALLASVYQGIRTDMPDARVAVTARQDIAGQAILPLRQKFRGHDRLALYRAALHSNHIVFGGGSTLHSQRDIDLKRHMLKLSPGSRHSAVGIGLGPFADRQTYQSCRRLLEQLSYVGVRDRQSLQICEDMDLQTKFELTFDLAPAYLHGCTLDNPQQSRTGIGINLCPLESLQCGAAEAELQRVDKLAQVLNEVTKITGEPVVLLDFNGHDELGDGNLNSRLQLALAPHVCVRRLPYVEDPGQHLRTIAGLRCLLAMRLHAQIYAYMADTPTIALQYHSKNRGWAEQIGMPQRYQFDCSSFDPGEMLVTLLQGLSHGFCDNVLPVRRAVTYSRRNWSFTDA